MANTDQKQSMRVPMIGQQYREQWKEWILMRLGHPVVKVEVTNKMLDLAIDEAVRRFSPWIAGGEKIGIFDTTIGVGSYDLATLIPEYQYVREVFYSPNYTDNYITSYASENMSTDFQFGGGTAINYYHGMAASMTDYALINMYTEMYRRLTGREGGWELKGSLLLLSPTPKINAVKFAVVYQSMLLDSDIRRDEWLKDWALTEVKLALGAVRRKYQGIPGPRGDTITMDGEALMTEAREDQVQLRERLNEFRDPLLISMA
jgi:hypothetical protein